MRANRAIKVTRKMRGRPATGHSPRIAVRLEQGVKLRLEIYAFDYGISLSEAIRRLIEAGLATL
jgi:macrodomain Ter protein organizer (MatP/YcbG family)